MTLSLRGIGHEEQAREGGDPPALPELDRGDVARADPRQRRSAWGRADSGVGRAREIQPGPFAKLLGVGLRTFRQYEQGDRNLTEPSAV